MGDACCSNRVLYQDRAGAIRRGNTVWENTLNRSPGDLRGMGGYPHCAHQHLHIRTEDRQDAVQNAEYYHLVRYVRMRRLGSHSYCCRLSSQEGGADPCRRILTGFYLHYDDCYACYHQAGGDALYSGRGVDGRNHRFHGRCSRCRSLFKRTGTLCGRYHKDDPE